MTEAPIKRASKRAPAKKAPAKKAAKKTGSGTERSLILETKKIKVADLHLYYKNPRIGDVNSIAISLDQNGQFRPIIVNIGTQTGRVNEVLAGNHTTKGAALDLVYQYDGQTYHKPAWKLIEASFVDVDEEQAAKINIADNRLAELGTYDEEVFAEVLALIENPAGIGFEPDDIESIMAALDTGDADQLIETFKKTNEEEDKRAKLEAQAKTFQGAPLGEEDEFVEDDTDDTPPEKPKKDGIEDADTNLGGMVQFKVPSDLNFPGLGYFGIPKLRDDMLMTMDDLPDTLETWAGSATKDDEDPDRWWFYNWGIDSTSGMKQDKSQVIVSFYAFDEYFDNWWYFPDRYFAKLLNSGIKYMLTPNWSQDSDLPRTEALYALYKSRWIGRYAQEVGIKVCPDITWPEGDIDFQKKYVLATLDKGLPLISFQLQTFDPNITKERLANVTEQFRNILEALEPQGILLYTGVQGRKMFTNINKGFNIPVKVLGTRVEKLSAQAKQREKKKGI